MPNEPIEGHLSKGIILKKCYLQSELVLLYREVLNIKYYKKFIFKTIGKLKNEVEFIRKKFELLQKQNEEFMGDRRKIVNEKEENHQEKQRKKS